MKTPITGSKYQPFVLVSSFLFVLFSGISASADSNLDQRLTHITERFEAARQEMHIPGMALAIVKDDEIILARGFGYRDVEGKVKVTPETNFAIGSTSKAFTSTLVGMLSDQGKMDWDDKVTDYLDWFKPNLNDETGNLTIRDMLSHRSGLSRNDILWVSGKVDPETMLRESLDAEPLDPFRKKFNYNNILFLATGMASAKAAEVSDWDTLLEERLLKPLRMSSSTSRNDKATNMANGYRWDQHDEAFIKLDKKNLDNISPAGGIHSNVLDMAQWLRFNLNKGTYEGKQLLSEAQFDELWSTAITVAPGMDYGLGWFVRDWQGKKVVEHGGNIQGFAAQVALMPEENIGFVLLTNTSITPLQQGSMDIVWRGLFDDLTVSTNEKPMDDLSRYTGRYVANFGPFKNAIFTVQLNDDGDLAVDVPGQQLYALHNPDETGKWYFKLTNTIAVSFSQFANDKANVLTMHQNGMDFESPREGVEIAPEVDLAEFADFLGNYTHPNLPRPIVALIQNNRLAIDVPGEMIYELRLPDEDGHRSFRINDDLSAKFTVNKDSSIESVGIYRGKQLALEAKRVLDSDTEVSALPTLDDILKLMKAEQQLAAYRKLAGLTLKGSTRILQAGLEGKVTTHIAGDDKFAQLIDFGDYGYVSTVLNGDFAAVKGIQPYTELKGDLLEQLKNDHPVAGLDWLAHYDSMKVIEKRVVRGKDALLVELKEQGLPDATIAIDSESGVILTRRGSLLVQDIGAIPIQITYDDYRDIEGLWIPFKMTLFNPMSGNTVIEYESIETNKTFDADTFELME